MSNSFIMTESIVRPSKMPYGRLKDNGFVGIEGEHAARALVVETKDDLSAFASVNLIIDDLDCGAMTKTTSGNTTTLSMTLTSSMIGRSGRKICQLIMVNSGNTVVQKSSQFEAYVGRANEIERSVDDGVTIIILSEAVTEMAQEAAAAAAQEAAASIVEDCQASAAAAAQSAQEAEEAAASITVDATLDPTSTHAIQNKAVASEISSIKADLGDVSEKTENLNTSRQGRFYANVSGEIKPSSEYYIGMGDKVPCNADTAYTVAVFDSEISNNKTTVYAVWYTSAGVFIQRDSQVNTPSTALYRTFTSPENAKYMYFDFYNNTSGISANAKISVVEGNEAPEAYTKPYTAKDLMARKAAANNTESVTAINGRLDLIAPKYPSYFEENISEAISNIRANMGLIGVNGDSFIYFTDPHWGINQKHSPAIIKHLLEHTEMRNVFCGGDALDSGTKEAEIAKGYDFMNAFSFVPGGLKYVVGNHDNNVNQHSEDSSYWLTTEQVYSIFFPKAEMEWKGIRATSGLVSSFRIGAYFDVPSTKTRYINVGSPFGTMQSSWINWVKSLIEEDSTTNVVLFAHYLYHPTDGFTADAQALISMCDLHANVKAVIFGHIHADLVRYSATGIPLIATDTDAASRLGSLNPNTATVGTITEHVIDGITVSYASKDVMCARVGRGKNRYVRGGNVDVATNDTVTLTTAISSAVWSSSDSSVATVANGVVSGVSAGDAVIMADGTDGQEFWHVVVS